MKRCVALAVLMLGGCTSAVPQGEDTGSTGSSSSSSSSTGPAAATSSSTGEPNEGSTGTAGPGSSDATGSAWETEGADEGYATTGNCGFTCPPPPGPGSGGGTGIECSLSDQDCSEGEKCNPWANDGGGLWTGTRCVPLDPEPAGLDEPCVIEGAFVSGIDTCEPGLVCSPSGPDSLRTNAGVCIALCGADPCGPGTLCTVAGPLNVGTCGAICDPLTEGACPPGTSCMPAGLGFACNFTQGLANDAPCDVPGLCDVGHVCTDASQCDGNPDETCCAQLCDLDAPSCPGAQTCTSYGSPLSAYSAVGFCED